MHEKYGKDGLVILTVTLDDPKDAKTRALSEGFLAKVKPPFRTLNLNATPEKLPPTLNFNGFPGAFVFNRQNQYVKKLPLIDPKGEPIEDFDYDVLMKAAITALDKK